MPNLPRFNELDAEPIAITQHIVAPYCREDDGSFWYLKEYICKQKHIVEAIKEVIACKILRLVSKFQPDAELVFQDRVEKSIKNNRKVIYVALQKIVNYRDFKKNYDNTKIDRLSAVLLGNMLVQENDMSIRNLCFSGQNKDSEFIVTSFDHNRAFIHVYQPKNVSLYCNQISVDDLENLPVLTTYYPDSYCLKVFYHDLKYNEKFNFDKYFYLLKLVLVSEEEFKSMIFSAINPDVINKLTQDAIIPANVINDVYQCFVEQRRKMLVSASKLQGFIEFCKNIDEQTKVSLVDEILCFLNITKDEVEQTKIEINDRLVNIEKILQAVLFVSENLDVKSSPSKERIFREIVNNSVFFSRAEKRKFESILESNNDEFVNSQVNFNNIV